MSTADHSVAFVLGGGGALGAHEVGMFQALAESGVRPDLVLGTSVGALNGALIADDPTVDGAARLAELWQQVNATNVFGSSLLRQVGTLARSGTHLQSSEPLRSLLNERLSVANIGELAVPFQCVAASIERAAEHWFTDGPISDAVLASAAVPGLLPAVELGGEHFIDGGIVNSIPVGRAISLGAHTVYVLQVGRLERPLRAPRWPWEVGLVAFEVARRHRFRSDMESLPGELTVHVLPTGGSDAPAFDDLSGQLRYRDFSRVERRIDSAYEASLNYLSGLDR